MEDVLFNIYVLLDDFKNVGLVNKTSYKIVTSSPFWYYQFTDLNLTYKSKNYTTFLEWSNYLNYCYMINYKYIDYLKDGWRYYINNIRIKNYKDLHTDNRIINHFIDDHCRLCHKFKYFTVFINIEHEHVLLTLHCDGNIISDTKELECYHQNNYYRLYTVQNEVKLSIEDLYLFLITLFPKYKIELL